MSLFLSTFEKHIDKKGRVSVPAQFRAALGGEHYQGVVAYPSFVRPCIEVCPMSRIEALYKSIERLDPFSEEHDAFAGAILAASVQLPFDGEGRIILPASLLEEAGVNGEAVFVGKGGTFEIWEPQAYRLYAKEIRRLAMERRGTLRAEHDG